MSTLRHELLTAPHGKTDDLMDAFVLILRSVIKYAAHNLLPISYLHHKVPGHFWTKHK